ncbi:MAG: energy-coupling factor transporter transmembrane protein EcfT [Selenomonadaceae bacterium]|nr:energy-coupling factor transporter transmembrane protein EcfT [Selenomonadaceae bacterium]
MLQDITLGQFFPGKSILHKLDPRTKIILLLTMIILIFAAKVWAAYLVLSLFTIALIFLSRVPFLTVIKSVKPLSWIILFTMLIHCFSHDGEIIAKVYVFKLTWEGIIYGAKISLQLILLIVLSSLLTFTTSPLKLTDATEKLLSPLRRIGVPAHELAMMMTIAIRFVPTLIEETDKIIKAQKSRGLDFNSGGVFKRLGAMVPILVPLFLSAFRRADDLALAMEARCYHGGEGRTHMKQLHLTNLDFYAAAIVLLMGSAIIFLSWNLSAV